jgi:hypothetical protein
MEFSLSFFQEETTQRTIQTSLCPSQTYQNQFYIYCDHPRSWNMIISLPRHHHFGIGGPRLSTLMALGHLGRMGGRVNLGHCFGCSMYKIVDDLWMICGSNLESVNPTTSYLTNRSSIFFPHGLDQSNAFKCDLSPHKTMIRKPNITGMRAYCCAEPPGLQSWAMGRVPKTDTECAKSSKSYCNIL